MLCWPDATRRELDAVIDFLEPLETPFKTIPPVDDILAGKVQISDIRDVEIEDLLERPPIRTQMDRIVEIFKQNGVRDLEGGHFV